MDMYEDKAYENLKRGIHNVKVSKGFFTCPYCPAKRYSYTDVVQHATGVGNSSSAKRNAKEKANHLALLKYLVKDLANVDGPSKPADDRLNGCNQNAKDPERTFACPCCPMKLKRDYLYIDLLQHASGVGNSSSTKRSAKEKANHLALMKYLKRYRPAPSKPSDDSDPLASFTSPCFPMKRKRDSDTTQLVSELENSSSSNGSANENANASLMKYLKKYLPEGPSKIARYDLLEDLERTFTCPCCPTKLKHDHLYRDLIQHATAVGNGNSTKRSSKEKANHLVLMKCLEKYLPGPALVYSSDPSVKVSAGTFTCPCCPMELKRGYLYRDLVQHALGVANSDSAKRSAKEKADHLALTKYLESSERGFNEVPICWFNEIPGVSNLEKDLAMVDGPSESFDFSYPPYSCDDSQKIVWPWTGIVVNFTTRVTEDLIHVGESGSKYRDELIGRGFNPARVIPLPNLRGETGSAIVEFNNDWPGLNNALSFEKAYEADHRGKKDWPDVVDANCGLYAWVARVDDYYSLDIVGENLRRTSYLRTISEIMEEESRKHDKLVSNLTNTLEVNNKRLIEMEQRCNETSISINNVIDEKERLLQSCNEEIRKFQQGSHDHFQRIFKDHEKLKQQLESHEKELELRKAELEMREVRNETERRMLFEENEKNSWSNLMLEQAALEEKKNDETVLKLTEDHKRQKEEHHNKIIQLQKQLDAKQALELEIEQTRGVVTEMERMASDGDMEVLKTVAEMLKEMMDKEGELEDVNAQYQSILMRMRTSNEELQEAHKEFINCLKDISSSHAHIRVRRMGQLNTKPFYEAMRKRYNKEEGEERAIELCSLWEEYLRDPGWHPFKNIEVAGKHERVIDDQNERLASLQNDLGDEVYKAVTDALLEIVEYNPSGSYVTSVLWNYKENKKATLKEGIKILLNEWETAKAKSKSQMY